MDTESAAVEETAFRPAKRRKFTRNKQTSRRAEQEPNRADTASPESDWDALNAPVKDILRHRMSRTRKAGIEFSNARARSSESAPPSAELVAVDPAAERMKAISDRFVAHSGQVIDVDKHMFVFPTTQEALNNKVTDTDKSRVTYIESEMAKRRLGLALPQPSTVRSPAQNTQDGDRDPSGKPTLPRQPAGVGKIHEIDLGRDASVRNRERTELAIRRARGEQVAPDEPPMVKKPRLGRNGKPRRGPKRRNSEDVKRDQLVEEVLHESRLEIYDEPEAEEQEESLDTDDRVAEQFRRDFIDAMQARHRHRHAGQPKPPNQKQGDQTQRGPKLGGSRSARAAMREQQEKAAKK